MALGPQILDAKFAKEITELVTDQYLTESINFEKDFDTQLTTGTLDPDGNISLAIPNGFKEEHFSIVRSWYMDAGWKDVEWISNEGSGDTLQFKAIQ